MDSFHWETAFRAILEILQNQHPQQGWGRHNNFPYMLIGFADPYPDIPSGLLAIRQIGNPGQKERV
ncbi:MAG: hypothetical protein CVV64_02620 [Candidatus Wallbacteria bacterium HGW-Wallbacteria-1]|jgi:hypothetical protein|uniref:Uncharacterized protein n=1 Tax=Candidatus Wallbacteria bacterium HGW-Wallbacteria-1 TaxID=2013854 RepID=A0A2N1PVH2_9BACT|nr:MAG: hypothetical protein CVV64_02620 [Candidatus Wallbacteria bacterium HGW-Wallbacteria-1]